MDKSRYLLQNLFPRYLLSLTNSHSTQTGIQDHLQIQAVESTIFVSDCTNVVMALPDTRDRAKELVQRIAKNHGYLGEKQLHIIEPELRREIEEAFMKKNQMIGVSMIM